MTEKAASREVTKGAQKMTSSEAFVETLVSNDVTDIFGIMGSAFMDAMDIFAPAGIELVPVVHEQGAAHMADGYARASGRHGVVIGQNGPGISNCVTAIAAAYWAHSPVVIVTPEAGTNGIGLGGFQEANQLPMFQEFTKYQGHVTHPARMAEFTDMIHPDLLGLTGSVDEVTAVSRAWRGYFQVKDQEDKVNYLVDHTTQTYLILPGHGTVEFFPRDVSPEQMADRVACFVNAS